MREKLLPYCWRTSQQLRFETVKIAVLTLLRKNLQIFKSVKLEKMTESTVIKINSNHT